MPRLNKKLLRSGRLKLERQKNAKYSWMEEDVFVDTKHPEKISLDGEEIRVFELSCCGISEVSLNEFVGIWSRQYRKIDPTEVIANMINLMAQDDRRVLIWGRPVIQHNDSMYNKDFYEAMEDCMRKIGFKQLNKRAYTNSNSGNKIKVFVGQLP